MTCTWLSASVWEAFSGAYQIERENLLILGTRGQTRPLLELLRLSNSEHRKPRPTDFIKREWHILQSDDNLQEFFFEVFI